jgi:hypothetical protein
VTAELTGTRGELLDRLLDVLDAPGPQLRAVVTTLIVIAIEPPDATGPLLEAMVASDDAAAMIDPAAAAESALRLRTALEREAAGWDEPSVVRVLRDHVLAQVDRWASRSVDDADTRRRAEKFLAWADRPDQLARAQQRGLFAGMQADELRRLAARQAASPVSPETALQVWAEVHRWNATVTELVGDDVLAEWCRLDVGRADGPPPA